MVRWNKFYCSMNKGDVSLGTKMRQKCSTDLSPIGANLISRPYRRQVCPHYLVGLVLNVLLLALRTTVSMWYDSNIT